MRLPVRPALASPTALPLFATCAPGHSGLAVGHAGAATRAQAVAPAAAQQQQRQVSDRLTHRHRWRQVGLRGRGGSAPIDRHQPCQPPAASACRQAGPRQADRLTAVPHPAGAHLALHQDGVPGGQAWRHQAGVAPAQTKHRAVERLVGRVVGRRRRQRQAVLRTGSKHVEALRGRTAVVAERAGQGDDLQRSQPGTAAAAEARQLQPGQGPLHPARTWRAWGTP